MSAKHTPSPWWATGYGVRDRGGYICHTQPPTHFPDQDERFANEVEERKANARLIAVAPELLSALLELSQHFHGEWEHDTRSQDEIDDHSDQAQRMARAAIAKATGSAA